MSDEQLVEEESKPSSKSKKTKGRKPQRSSRIEPTADYSEVDDPREQYSIPGQEPMSRFEQVREAGGLDGFIGGNVFRKERENLLNEQNAFIAWQAETNDYVIYQNTGYDENEGKDKWDPQHYQYYPLTVGQRLGLQKVEAEVADIARSVQNNDRTVSNANAKFVDMSINLLKEQCALYLRMDVEKEFEISNYADTTLAVTSAKYAEQHVPAVQKKRLPTSSSTKKSTGVG